MKKRHRHKSSLWLIAGGRIAWCYQCGAWRGDWEKRWHRTTGIGGPDPCFSEPTSEQQDAGALRTELDTVRHNFNTITDLAEKYRKERDAAIEATLKAVNDAISGQPFNFDNPRLGLLELNDRLQNLKVKL